MVLPIGDDNSDRRIVPVVNWVLIAINVFVFFVLQGAGANEKFTYAFSTVPKEIVTGKDVDDSIPISDPRTGKQEHLKLEHTPITVYITLITSMFMHGSIMHLVGNMLFLWIFGDNLEDLLGHGRYVVFYLICGVVASLAHVFTTYAFGGNPLIPSLGASGAISGVLGGYVFMFPHRRVTVIMFRMLTQVPAFVALGLWFAFQILEGVMSLGSKTGGVAYGAHVGGFIAGLALIKPFSFGREGQPGWPPRPPQSSEPPGWANE